MIRDALATAKGTPFAVQYDALEGIRDLAGSFQEVGDVTAADALRSTMKALRDRLGGALDRPVNPAIDGAFVLTSATADLHGISLQLQPDGSIGRWIDRDESVLWTLAPAAPGAYRVEIQYGCGNESAGSDLVVEVAGQSLAAVVQPRDGLQQHAVSTLGTIWLPHGTTKLIVRPSAAGTFHAPLMNLRAVQLTPLPPSTQPSL